MEFKHEYGTIEAMMVMIVAEAGNIVRVLGGRVTRGLIQTTVCYLQAHRIRTDFEFIMTPSGPLCEGIFHTLDNLEEDGVIVNQSLRPELYADYAVGPGSLVLLPLHTRTNDLFRPAVVKVLEALTPFERSNLELVHNLHFYYLTLKTAAPSLGVYREKVVGTVVGARLGERVEVVPKVRWERDIEEAKATYDRLVAACLIAPDQESARSDEPPSPPEDPAP